MRPKGQTLSEKIGRWEVLAVQLAEDDVSQLPAHETEQLASLQEALLEARQIGVRQEAARAVLRGLGNELRQLVRKGDGVRGRLGASLKGRLGFTADQLVRYGFTPISTNRRSRGTSPAAEKEQAQGAQPEAVTAV